MMLQEKYSFSIHSFVDLITNSSTEIYIEADEDTIKSVQEMINKLLEIGGSELKCDDLFTLELGKQHEYSRDVALVVKCRDENSNAGKQAAKMLSNLTNMFSMSAEYNG